MKAAILTELNKSLLIDDIRCPDKLDVGQVLVRVMASGICGAQIGEITGAKGPDKYLPHLLGHEGGGKVLAIGPGVSTVKIGDHVCLHWRKGAGIEAQPPKYDYQNEKIGGGWVTTFNECAVVSENRVTAIDKSIPFEVLALMGCAVTTGFGLVNNEAKLKIGQTIAVAGCGGVGLNVIQAAKLVCAGEIFAIDIKQNKLDLAEKYGATHLINSSMEQDFIVDEINRGTGGNGVDVFVDCTGISSVIDIGLHMVKPGGKLILVGQPRIGERLSISNMRANYCGKIIMDSQGGMTNPTIDIPRYCNLWKAGKINFDDMITHRLSLDQVNLAIDHMRDGRAGRIILEMN